jgi:hypothetical protein
MNRLKDYFNNPPEPESQDDFYVVEKRYGSFAVSRQTAAEIESVLDQAYPPRWVVFRDLNGSRHRILADQISRISESTAAQRAADRAFDRARRLEDKQDRRPWEDDDC